MNLSILIATIPERIKSFTILVGSLIDQANGLGDHVEILFENCDRDEMSIGAKRQKLLERATGKYIVFIDDDDTILPNYVEKVLEAIESNPDSVGMNILFLKDGMYNGMCRHSKKYSKWHQIDSEYYRGVTQFNPVKRELALRAGFADLRYGEDIDYSGRLTNLCQSEVEINEIIYIYNYSGKVEHNKKYGIQG